MAEVFKPTFHEKIPADAKFVTRDGRRFARFKIRSGRTVEGEVLANGKARVESEKYYGRVTTADGRRVRKCLGVADRHAAVQVLARLTRETELERAGLLDPFEKHRRTPLIGTMVELPKRKHDRNKYGRITWHASQLARADLDAAIEDSHLANFTAHLRAGGRTERHVGEMIRSIRRVAIDCGFEFLRDLDAGVLERHLAAIIAAGKSYRTRNAVLKSLRTFVNWLIRTDRMPGRDPFRTIAALNEEADPNRRRRRALTTDEFRKLLTATEKAGIIEGLDGTQRRMLYLLAAWTGLRKSELAALKVTDLVLDGDPPFVHLPAAVAKARRDDQPIPLHPFVAQQLAEWINQRKRKNLTTAFDLTTRGGYLRKTSKMMELDCASAGIPYQGDLGVADFHSHRVQFISALCRTADFSTAVELARHKDPKLTSRVYDRVRLEGRTIAINSLALPTGDDRGTNDAEQTPCGSRAGRSGKGKRTA